VGGVWDPTTNASQLLDLQWITSSRIKLRTLGVDYQVNSPLNQLVHHSASQFTIQPVDSPLNQSIHHSTSQLIEQPVEVPACRSIYQPFNQHLNPVFKGNQVEPYAVPAQVGRSSVTQKVATGEIPV
jgi:hypothetical protein